MNIQLTKQCKACGIAFPCSIVVNGKRIDLRGNSYCPECLPLGSGKRPQLYKRQIIDGVDNRKCPHCSLFKPLNEFYLVGGNGPYKDSPSGACRECDKLERKARGAALKRRAIEYKGGKCTDCDGVFHDCLYDFHHIEQHTKEFNIGSVRWVSWKRVQKELDKCVLLCAHCHRLRHHAVSSIP